MSDDELSNNIPELKRLIINQHNQLVDQRSELSEKDILIKDLQDRINLLQRKHFAPQSEQVTSEELGLFNEAEDLGQNNEDDSEDNKAETEEVTKKDKVCIHDGSILVKIGEEVSEKLIIIPAKAYVEKTIRNKYSCPCCDESIKTPPVPLTLLPKTMASASLIAYIIIAKFMDGLPLYRQEVIFARIGAILTRQTMARWMIQVSQKLMPLYNLLQDELLARDYIQMDETTVQVLKEDGKKATSKSYMWVRHAPGNIPIVLYDYSPTRSGEVPVELLSGFRGHLQADGYDGYARVCSENKLIRLGCMDHARRKFEEAFKTSGGKSIGKKGLIFFKALYKVEDKIEKMSPEMKYKIRQEESSKILTDIKKWVDEMRQVTPKSVGGKAINYFFNEYNYLIKYLDDGKLNISNCGVENKIRPFAIGRKNWLFSTSVDGAQASAMFYSLIETAKANDLEPFDWLSEMLEKLPHATTVEDYEALLPFQKK